MLWSLLRVILLRALMSSTNKRPRTERLAASVLPGTAVPRQPSNGVAVGSHISEGRTCQPAPSLGRAAGAQDTHGDVLAHLKTCAQVLCPAVAHYLWSSSRYHPAVGQKEQERCLLCSSCDCLEAFVPGSDT